MSLRNTMKYGSWNLDTANQDTKMILSTDFRHGKWTLIADNSFSGTVKFYTSNQETRPDLDSAASATNMYSTVDVIYTGGATGGDTIDGDTGFVAAGSSDGIYTLAVNEDLQRRVGAALTAVAAGDVTLELDMGDNQ